MHFSPSTCLEPCYHRSLFMHPPIPPPSLAITFTCRTMSLKKIFVHFFPLYTVQLYYHTRCLCISSPHTFVELCHQMRIFLLCKRERDIYISDGVCVCVCVMDMLDCHVPPHLFIETSAFFADFTFYSEISVNCFPVLSSMK